MKKCAVYNLKNDRLQGKVLEPLISQEYINKLTIINKIKNQPYMESYIIVNFKTREINQDTLKLIQTPILIIIIKKNQP